MAPLQPLQDKLFAEMQQNAATNYQAGLFPFKQFWSQSIYFYYINESLTYSVYYRWPQQTTSALSEINAWIAGNRVAQLLLDVNILATGLSYLAVGIFEVSNDENLLAFSIDRVGNEHFELFAGTIGQASSFKSIANDTYYSVRFDATGSCIYYSNMDSQNIPRYVYSSCNNGSPALVYNETDPTLYAEIDKTNDGQLVSVRSVGQITSASRFLYANGTLMQPFMSPTKVGVQYEVEHRGYVYYIRSNHLNPNFGIYSVASSDVPTMLSLDNLVSLLEAGATQFIERIEVFKDILVAWMWQNGIRVVCLYDFTTQTWKTIIRKSSTDVYTVYPATITDMENRLYRNYYSRFFLFSNNSYVIPSSSYEYEFATGIVQVVPLSISTASTIVTEKRVLVDSYDNLQIPMSLVYLSDIANSSRPTLMYAYGAYGSFIQPASALYIMPLLQRGFVLAFVHPRGDGDMNSSWYNDGRLDLKMNTFLDIRRCMLYLTQSDISSTGKISLLARSAGGLIAGTTANWFSSVGPPPPETIVGSYSPAMLNEINAALSEIPSNRLINTIIAQVPFLDAVNDMLDASVAWTAYEWTEWGNPNNLTIFHAMMDYSPYENVNSNVPNLYISSGLKDTRVNFIEPTRWTAKIRSVMPRCPSSSVLLSVGDYGHFGGTGSNALREAASWMSFLLRNMNLTSLVP